MRYHLSLFTIATVCLFSFALLAAPKPDVDFPPKLPGGKQVVTFSSPELLKPVGELQKGVTIAKEAPTVDFLYYDCQTYEGNPWSNWGDGLAIEGKYYSAVGDHKSPMGNAFVYEYDAETKKLRQLVDVRKVLKQPDGWYTPGKIHSRVDLGRDGKLYFSTHRGSTRVANDPKNHFQGDWIMRCDPSSAETEVVVHAPLKMQSLPTGQLDPQRLIWYAGTADGLREKEPMFLAYDCEKGRILYSDDYGPYRYLIYSQSTGKVYFHREKTPKGEENTGGKLRRFDPENPGKPKIIDAKVGLRCATGETADGKVYTVDRDNLWVFDCQDESARHLGPTAVASQTYTTSIDADPTGRYLYYVPGAHGGAERDGTPLVQYDTKNKTRKVICFLHPYIWKNYGYVPIGTFSTAVSPDGSKVYITWNGCHGLKKLEGRVPFASTAMSVVHIPENERKP